MSGFQTIHLSVWNLKKGWDFRNPNEIVWISAHYCIWILCKEDLHSTLILSGFPDINVKLKLEVVFEPEFPRYTLWHCPAWNLARGIWLDGRRRWQQPCSRPRPCTARCSWLARTCNDESLLITVSAFQIFREANYSILT